MITVTIIYDSNQMYRAFSCKGHAGFAKYGKDVVCAAVSILVINTVNVLEELAGESLRIEADEDGGWLKCEFQAKPAEKSIFLLDVMVYGLKNIQQAYGKKHLQIRYEEV